MKHVIEIPNIQKPPRIRPLLAMDYDGNLLRLPKVFVPEGFVDLDLPSGTMWAKCNVGASSITGYGHYFMWGDSEPADERTCDWANYKHANGAYDKLTKYCNDINYWDNDMIGPDNQQTLFAYDDPASDNYTAAEAEIRMAIKITSNYHSPTNEQINELLNLPNKWTTINGINGRVFYRKDEPGLIPGDWSILNNQNLWLYDAERNVRVRICNDVNILANVNQDNIQNDRGLGNLVRSISVNQAELESKSKEAVNAYFTSHLQNIMIYRGEIDIDTMLFLDSEYTNLAVEGENYTCVTLPENFDENYMLFIPAAGYKNSDDIVDVGVVSVLWSSQAHFNMNNILMQKQNSNNRIIVSRPFNAYSLFLSAIDANIASDPRCSGYTVRAVYSKLSNNSMLIDQEMAK